MTPMDFELTSEQRLIQDAMRRMSEREIVPILKANNPTRPLPKEAMHCILKACASQGLTAPRIPEADGGAGLSALTLGLMYEQLSPAIAFDVLAHETVARIHFDSTDEQKTRFLPDLIAADRIACTATTEPAGGSDTRSIATRATLDGDHYVLNGRKMWISGITTADVVNVTAQVQGGVSGRDGIARFLVEREHTPFETRTIDTLGLKQAHLGEVVFDNCRVPRRNLCGAIGDAPKVLTLSWLINRPVIGLMAVAMAQTALDAALKYAADRTQFGRPLAQFQLIQELLADTSPSPSRAAGCSATTRSSASTMATARTMCRPWPNGTRSLPASAPSRWRWKFMAPWVSQRRLASSSSIATFGCCQSPMAPIKS